MKKIEATNLDEIVAAFAAHPKQEIFPADMPYKLRFGWKIKNPELMVFVRLSHIQCWTKDLLDMCASEDGRRKMQKLIAEQAWPS